MTWQDVTQWTHNLGYANDWDKPQHTLSKWTCEYHIQYVLTTFIKNGTRLPNNIEQDNERNKSLWVMKNLPRMGC